MEITTSADATVIAYERYGDGSTLVLVGGGFSDRNAGMPLAALLQDRFTVITYDRRGRGDSTDTAPYAVAREVEDLAAVVAANGGSTHVFGWSSGAILALEAAAAGTPLTKLALFEPPYVVDGSRPPIPDLGRRYEALCASGDPGAAVALFLTDAMGQPKEVVDSLRASPMWPGLEDLAHTLAYEATLTGDGTLATERLASIHAPALLLDSTNSPDWHRTASRAVAATLPQARHGSIEGGAHEATPNLVAPLLVEFLLD